LVFEKKIIGHRGAAAHAPENTLVAFENARALNCHCIEFDVMLSVDGEAFVFHDDTLHRTTNGFGKFGLATSQYLKSLDAGRWFSKAFRGEKIPTFREVLEWLALSEMHANVEIKPFPGSTEQTTLAVLHHIRDYWPVGKALPLVSSFDVQALVMCHRLAPELPLGLLLHHWDEHWKRLADDLNCVSVHLNRHIATKSRVHAIKKAGFLVYVYTVNSKRLATKLFDWGVDAVFSDYLVLNMKTKYQLMVRRLI